MPRLLNDGLSKTETRKQCSNPLLKNQNSQTAVGSKRGYLHHATFSWQICLPGAASLAIWSSRFNICVFCSQKGVESFPWSVTFSREGPASVRRDLTPTNAPPMLEPRKTISQNVSQVWPPFLGDWRSVWVQVLDRIQKRPTEVSPTLDRGARRRDRAMGWEREQMEVEKGGFYKKKGSVPWE